MKESQHIDELMFLCEKAKGATSFLEIGSRYGETLRSIAECMSFGARIVSVDLPNGPWGRMHSNFVLEEECKRLHALGYDVHLFLANSRDESVVSAVEALGPFDFVFIDGDHQYDGVKFDWETYGKMGKVVAFHDIIARQVPSGTGHVMQVPKLWEEIRHDYQHEVCIGKNSLMGVGVIYRDIVS